MIKALCGHWPEYLMEAAGLGIVMVSVCTFATILEYPTSPVRQVITDLFLRRILIGVVVGLTITSIIYSPWGKRSGAHINPSITLTFFRLRKIKFWDAIFYVIAQFLGALAGVLLSAVVIGTAIADPSINYVVTIPGVNGIRIAFLAEFIISFVLMFVILMASNTLSVARFTGLLVGVLIAIYITLETPLSGMSINPARTFGSALSAHLWTAIWVYFTAPPLGMLLAAEVYLWLKGSHSIFCAKLYHQNNRHCIFHCSYPGVKDATKLE